MWLDFKPVTLTSRHLSAAPITVVPFLLLCVHHFDPDISWNNPAIWKPAHFVNPGGLDHKPTDHGYGTIHERGNHKVKRNMHAPLDAPYRLNVFKHAENIMSLPTCDFPYTLFHKNSQVIKNCIIKASAYCKYSDKFLYNDCVCNSTRCGDNSMWQCWWVAVQVHAQVISQLHKSILLSRLNCIIHCIWCTPKNHPSTPVSIAHSWQPAIIS